MTFFLKIAEAIGRQIERVIPASIAMSDDPADNTELGAPHNAFLAERDRVVQTQMLRDIVPYAFVPNRPTRRHESPLAAFANAAIQQGRRPDCWPNLVRYVPAHSMCQVAVELAPHTFLVHAPLDRYYRAPLRRVFEDKDHASEIVHRITFEQQDEEEDTAQQFELGPTQRKCRAQDKYAAHDWVVYTHATSALGETIRNTLIKDSTAVDYSEFMEASMEVLGICAVPYPIVHFFCGDQASLCCMFEDPEESIISLPDTDAVDAFDTNAHIARQETLHGCTRSFDERWLVVPIWTLELHRVATRGEHRNGSAVVPHVPNGILPTAPRPTVANASWRQVSDAALELTGVVEGAVSRSVQPMPHTDTSHSDASAAQLHLDNALQLINLVVPRNS